MPVRTSGKVLVVDDEEDIRVLLTRALQDYGLQVAAAADGLEALELLRVDWVSLVIADVVMPRLDGLELISRMLANGLTTPVILLTGHQDSALLLKAIRLGAIDFLAKPFSRPEFDEVVRRGLAISNRLQQIDELLTDIGAAVAPKTHEKIEELRRQISLLRVLHARPRRPRGEVA